MADSQSEKKRKVKFASNTFLNNDNEKYKIIVGQLNDIIKNINENFDFKTYENTKMLSIEKVIINHIILLYPIYSTLPI